MYTGRTRERSPHTAPRRARRVARRALLVASLALLPPLLLLSAPGAGARQDGAGRGLGVRASVGELPARAKRYALVVGVDDYADPQIGRLGGAANDARLLASALVERAGFPPDQVILLATGEPPERQPTRGQIMRSLSNLARAVPADGLLLFSFAGHGIARGGRAFLLTSDAQLNGDLEVLNQTALEASWVRGKIEEGGVRQVLLLLDACRDDPRAGRSAAAGAVLTEEYRRAFDFERRNRGVEAFATLYATAVGGTAYEYKEKRNGYFTWAVVEGLRGGAADARGEVTLARLVKYVQESVKRRVELDLGRDYDQRPFADIEGYRAEDLVLAVAPAAPPRPPGVAAEAGEHTGDSKNSATPSRARTARKPEKSGRILVLPDGSDRGVRRLNTFWRDLGGRLTSRGLTLTFASELGNEDYWHMRELLQKLKVGDKGAGKKMRFAVIITGSLRLKSLPGYSGGYAVYEANGALFAIDADTGETLAQENVNGVRGFGNNFDQAEDGALAAAAEKISAAFVERVISSAR